MLSAAAATTKRKRDSYNQAHDILYDDTSTYYDDIAKAQAMQQVVSPWEHLATQIRQLHGSSYD